MLADVMTHQQKPDYELFIDVIQCWAHSVWLKLPLFTDTEET